MKSMNEGLALLSTYDNYFESGILNLPLALATIIGSLESSSKNIFFLVDYSSTSSDGIPLTSMIIDNYSISFSPGNIGYPVNNSVNIQPKLHISIAVV